MGLDALQHGQAAGDDAYSGATSPAALRGSASAAAAVGLRARAT